MDPSCKDMQKLKEESVITLSMVAEIFEDKKPVKIRKTIENIPPRTLIVLDALCNLFDEHGEEAHLSYDAINTETRANARRLGLLDKIDQKEVLQHMDHLEYYGLISFKQAKKRAKAGTSKEKLRTIALEVELKELSKELDRAFKRNMNKTDGEGGGGKRDGNKPVPEEEAPQTVPDDLKDKAVST